MSIHRPVGLAYLLQLPVVHLRQPVMQILHHFCWCQKQTASAHLFVWRPAELLHRLRRWPQVCTRRTCNWRPENRRRVGYCYAYQGRFKSFPVEGDDHFYQVTRSVERNALRANLVRRGKDWRRSSLWLRQHGTATKWGLLAPWPLPEPADGRQQVNEPQIETASISIVPQDSSRAGGAGMLNLPPAECLWFRIQPVDLRMFRSQSRSARKVHGKDFISRFTPSPNTQVSSIARQSRPGLLRCFPVAF